MNKELKIPEQERPKLTKDPLDERNFESTGAPLNNLDQTVLNKKVKKLIQQFDDKFKVFDQ